MTIHRVLGYGLSMILGFNTAFAEISKVEVNIPSCTVKLLSSTGEFASYNIRVGKKEAQTATGAGVINEKREKILFRYLEGEKIGKVIEYSYIDPEKKTIKMPYDKMRGLGILMKRGGKLTDLGQVFHATTDYWTIGFPVSHGCIGLTIDDMLDMYKNLETVPVALQIKYETVFVENGTITFYPDFYGKGTNSIDNLLFKGVEIEDVTSANRRLKAINRELDSRLRLAKRAISLGNDPVEFRGQMNYTIRIPEFLEEYNVESDSIICTVEKGEGFIQCLKRTGVSYNSAHLLMDSIKGIDYKKMDAGDEIILTFEDGFAVKLEYGGRQGNFSFDLYKSDIKLKE